MEKSQDPVVKVLGVTASKGDKLYAFSNYGWEVDDWHLPYVTHGERRSDGDYERRVWKSGWRSWLPSRWRKVSAETRTNTARDQ